MQVTPKFGMQPLGSLLFLSLPVPNLAILTAVIEVI